MNNILNVDEDQLIELTSRLIKTSDKLKEAILESVLKQNNSELINL